MGRGARGAAQSRQAAGARTLHFHGTYDMIEAQAHSEYIGKEWIEMKVTICVGSTCHLLGSKRVVDRFKELVAEHNLADKVELGGKFCMGHCGEGVCVTIDGTTHTIAPEAADELFNSEILAKV